MKVVARKIFKKNMSMKQKTFKPSISTPLTHHRILIFWPPRIGATTHGRWKNSDQRSNHQEDHMS